MQKIFDAFAARKGIAATSLRFNLDGERVSGDQTPKMLDLAENDQIDVSLEMVRRNSCTPLPNLHVEIVAEPA